MASIRSFSWVAKFNPCDADYRKKEKETHEKHSTRRSSWPCHGSWWFLRVFNIFNGVKWILHLDTFGYKTAGAFVWIRLAEKFKQGFKAGQHHNILICNCEEKINALSLSSFLPMFSASTKCLLMQEVATGQRCPLPTHAKVRKCSFCVRGLRTCRLPCKHFGTLRLRFICIEHEPLRSLNNLNITFRSIYGGVGGMAIWHLFLIKI